MIRTPPTTIRAYWERQGRSELRAVIRHTQNDSTFRRLVQSACARSERSAGRGEQGLTIQDYRRRAIPIGPPFALSDKRPQSEAVSALQLPVGRQQAPVGWGQAAATQLTASPA